jgi:hypothetical protein
MLQNIIIGQVTGLLKKAIERFAEREQVSTDRVALWIYPKDTQGTPGLRLLIDLKQVSELEFGDLATKIQKITYSGMGFNIDKDTHNWIYKFVERVSVEKNIDITVPSYYLRILNDEIIAFMFLNNQKAIFFPDADDSIDKLAKYKITIDYILQTR